MGEHAMNIAVCDDQPEVLDVVENMLRDSGGGACRNLPGYPAYEG